jgi:hypothetical protein
MEPGFYKSAPGPENTKEDTECGEWAVGDAKELNANELESLFMFGREGHWKEGNMRRDDHSGHLEQ